MSPLATQAIWNPHTGITNLDDPEGLGASEIEGIRAVWTEQRHRLKDTKQFTEFTERLSREWAIETGIIENLYAIERGVTQTLIERGFQAELLSHGSTDRPREWVLSLLRDQKDALEGVFDFVRSNRVLSTSYIKELHAALLRSQHTTEAVDAQGRVVEVPLIKGDWKIQPNYPVRDGVQYLYCPPEQVAAEMDRLIALHQDHETKAHPPDVRAAWLHHRFTQIHPFQDGNGRVARAIASLVLIKDGLFPLVVTRDDKPVYLDALVAADGGRLEPLVRLFARLQVTQFRKASGISESLLAEKTVTATLAGLRQAAEWVAAERRAALKGVFDFAALIERNVEERLQTIRPDVETALLKIDPGARVFVNRSTRENDHYYRAQIIEIAKHHIGYFADTAEYRSWVAMTMRWSRRARLVFAIHGIGRPFNGSLICAPFLEFRDTDDDGETTTSLVPLTDEGFVFFYNEKPERLVARFAPWQEEILNVALVELLQNL